MTIITSAEWEPCGTVEGLLLVTLVGLSKGKSQQEGEPCVFHPLSIMIPVMILLPNLAFLRWPPRNMPELSGVIPIQLVILERIGQFGVIVIPLFYSIKLDRCGQVSLAAMVMFLLLYYGLWLRYYATGRQVAQLFAPSWGIPVAMAVWPVFYFISASIALHSVSMLVCSILFAAGHIPVSLYTYRKIQGHK